MVKLFKAGFAKILTGSIDIESKPNISLTKNCLRDLKFAQKSWRALVNCNRSISCQNENGWIGMRKIF